MAQFRRPINATGEHQQDSRLAAAVQWLDEVLPGAAGELRPASADASFRRYFRISCAGGSRILMDAPPPHERLEPFLQVAAWMSECGLQVPEVLAADPARGFALLGDLGTEPYLTRLLAQPQCADRLYREALDALVVLQSAGRRYQASLPDYGAELLAAEVELFREWCCRRHLGLELTGAEEALLDEARVLLCRSALEQPRVFVHRDYHSRNLMVREERSPGVLDFQDAVSGPITYDVVSLLKDCYVAWQPQEVRRWLGYYQARASAAGLPVGSPETLRRQFDWMGVQRHLKAAGIFARLCHRDGKGGYLDDIPRTLGYVQAVCTDVPALAPLGEFLRRRVVPRLGVP